MTAELKRKTFTGIAKGKHCKTPLAQAKGVFEGADMARQRVMAMWACRANCEHVQEHPFFDYEIEWEEEVA
jgi:hypothetical protein